MIVVIIILFVTFYPLNIYSDKISIAYNGVVDKAQPITTPPNLLNNFSFTENLLLQLQPKSKAETVEQTLKYHKC